MEMEICEEETKESLISAENPESPRKIPIPMRSFKFEPEWVQVLINLRMKYAKMFTRHRNAATDGWKLIFDELKESGAPPCITMANIKKKWMNLMARYREIKSSNAGDKNITWQYFEQIDRAFGPRFPPKNGDEADNKSDSSPLTDALLNVVNNGASLIVVNNDDRQNFIRKLIELRYEHRQLFTGKKYTARYGWTIIRTLLQCEDRYTVEQLSKCWQNLVQRYKQLMRSDKNVHITWPYFTMMYDWFHEDWDEENVNLDREPVAKMRESQSSSIDSSITERKEKSTPVKGKHCNESHCKEWRNDILKCLKHLETLIRQHICN